MTTGSEDLEKSKDSAEALAGPVDTATMPCKYWVGVEAHYDDLWQTPITSSRVRIEVDGAPVCDGPKTWSLGTFGREDGQEHQDVREELGRYRVNGVNPGSARVALVPEGGAGEAEAVKQEIYAKLDSFEEAVRAQVGEYLSKWAADGWSSVPEAYLHGLGKGGMTWWKGEVEFWSAAGGLAADAWDSTLVGIQQGWDWYSSLGYWERMYKAGPLSLHYYSYKAAEEIVEGLGGLWDKRDEIMETIRTLAEGSVSAIENALEVLKKLPGDIGKILTDVVENSAHWMQHLIEIVRDSTLLSKTFKKIMGILFLLTPNFWAEVRGMVEGFIIPEIVVTVILSLIGSLCTAASGGAAGAGAAAGLAVRITTAASKIKAAFVAAGKAGKVLKVVFDKIDEVFELFGKLSKSLRKQIDEVADGSTGTHNAIKRKSVKRAAKPDDLPCFKKPKNSTDKEFRRQLQEQEDAINSRDIAGIQQRRQAVKDAGGTKTIRKPKAQADVRKKEVQARAKKLMAADPNLSPEDATAQAKQSISKLDATHTLDIVAGGDPNDISGLADRSANRSLGSQWRTRVDKLDEALARQASAGNIKPNIKLVPCP